MTDSPEAQSTVAVAAKKAAKAKRSIVVVAGSGRSGTSLFAGILQRLGFYVPQPEVPTDATNPKGFAESQWVVDFHTALLKRARVQTSDARPTAWARMADLSLEESVHEQLEAWLRKQFGESDHVIIKDPRLSWFLPLWRRVGEELGTAPRFATLLRHPAAVIDSKQKWYGNWQGEAGRTAGWLNQVLFTERATRDAPRIFVRYEDLLDDWTRTVAHVGEVLDLPIIRDAPASRMIEVHQFVDRTLSRSQAAWGESKIPAALREQAEQAWELLSALADDDLPEREAVTERLDDARAAYIDLYEAAEAIAQSSIVAAGRKSGRSSGRMSIRAVRLAARLVPERFRRLVPPRVRGTLVRALQSGRSGT